jgi:hypothetical protein
LHRDWKGVACSIECEGAGEEALVLRVALASVDSPEALKSYMNVLLKANPFLAPFLLTRIPHRWGVVEGEEAVFAMRPPWARVDKNEAFLAYHPEFKDFKTLSASGWINNTVPM